MAEASCLGVLTPASYAIHSLLHTLTYKYVDDLEVKALFEIESMLLLRT